MYEYVLPFYVNAVDALPSPVAAASSNNNNNTTSSCLHIDQLFACNADDDDEAWTHVLLANYMIDLEWLLRAAPSLARVRDKLVLLSGERGSATMRVHYDAAATPTAWRATHTRSNSSNNSRHNDDNDAGSDGDDDSCRNGSEHARSVADEYCEAAQRHGLSPRRQLVVLQPPLPYAYGTHHTKMALCVNARGLRVAVFTANLVHDDWAYKTQGIYVQDFPRKATARREATAAPSSSSSSSSAAAGRAADFEQQLRRYLAYCGVAATRRTTTTTTAAHDNDDDNDERCRRRCSYGDLPLGLFSTDFLASFDFAAARVWLVCSVPGMHTSAIGSDENDNSSSSRARADGVVCNLHGFGLHRLAALTRMLTSARAHKGTGEDKHDGHTTRHDDNNDDAASYASCVWLNWQYSSQGALHDRFLRALQYAMLGGRDVASNSNNNNNNNAVDTTRSARATSASVAGVHVRVVYPTEDEVRESLEGWRGGLSLPVRARSAHAFVNARLYRWGARHTATTTTTTTTTTTETMTMADDVWRGVRRYALPHIKTYACVDATRRVARWFLLTSANLSQAAWGSPTAAAATTTTSRRRGGREATAARLFIRSYEMGVLYDASSAIRIAVDDDNGNKNDDDARVRSDDVDEEHANGCYTVTPSCPLPLPCAANSARQLYALPLAACDAATPPQPSSVLYVPYNVLAPTPYMSTIQQQQQHMHAAMASHGTVRGSKRPRQDDDDDDVHAAHRHDTHAHAAASLLPPSAAWDCTDVPWAVDMPHRGYDCLHRCADEALTQHTHYGPASWQAAVRTRFVEGMSQRRSDGGNSRNATATATTATKRARDDVEYIDVD